MHTRMRIAVAGATGNIGRHTVDVLEAGHDVVAMSRAGGVNLVTGEGLAEALAGVECVIDAAIGPAPDQDATAESLAAAAANLHAASEKAGVRQIVVASLIGADRFTAGYGAAKHAHEQAMLAGPVPVRLLRAAVLHESVPQRMAWGRRGDVAHLPVMRIQPVAARSVALALAELATAPADTARPASAGRPVPEVAGPREEDLVGLARLLAAWRGDPVRVQAVRDPANPDLDLFEHGGLLPGPHATRTGPTFREWLEVTV